MLANALVFLGCAIQENFLLSNTLHSFINASIILEPSCLFALVLWGQVSKITHDLLKAVCFFVSPLIAMLPSYYFCSAILQTSYSLSLLVLYALLLSCAVLIYFDWRKKSLSPALLEAQLSELQSKMKPHFFFNTICGISTLIYSNPQHAEDALLNLADIFRASLKKHSTFTTLAEEVELSKKYLFIESMRFAERLDVQWDLDEDVLSYKIPSLILQPLIENAISHGLEAGSSGQILIRIGTNAKKTHLCIQVANPLPSMNQNHTPNAHRKNTGSALYNISQRLELLFQEHARLQSSPQAGSWISTIEIELRALSS